MSNLVSGKTLCEVFAVAGAMQLPVAYSRVNSKLSLHGFVQPSLQQDDNRTWGRSFSILDPTHG